MSRIYASNDPLHDLWEISNDMAELLDANQISSVEIADNRMFANSSHIGVIGIEIDGDWKHDHLRADYLIKENFPVIKTDKVITEDTEYDWYPAIHYYYVDIRDYLE